MKTVSMSFSSARSLFTPAARKRLDLPLPNIIDDPGEWVFSLVQNLNLSDIPPYQWQEGQEGGSPAVKVDLQTFSRGVHNPSFVRFTVEIRGLGGPLALVWDGKVSQASLFVGYSIAGHGDEGFVADLLGKMHTIEELGLQEPIWVVPTEKSDCRVRFILAHPPWRERYEQFRTKYGAPE